MQPFPPSAHVAPPPEPPRRDRPPWWKRGPRIPSALFLAALFLLLPMAKERNSFLCADCGSHRAQWRLCWGVWGRWVPLYVSEKVSTTPACEEFFGPDHRHRFPLGNGRVEGVLLLNTVITGGVQYCGVNIPNPFLRTLNDSKPFRDAVQERVARGEISVDGVRRLCALKSYSQLYRSGTLPPGTHALVRRANAWLREAGEDPLWPEGKGAYPWPPEESP